MTNRRPRRNIPDEKYISVARWRPLALNGCRRCRGQSKHFGKTRSKRKFASTVRWLMVSKRPKEIFLSKHGRKGKSRGRMGRWDNNKQVTTRMRGCGDGGERYRAGRRYSWTIRVENISQRCEKNRAVSPVGWPITVEIRTCWMIKINLLRNAANSMYSPLLTFKISAFLYVSQHCWKNSNSQHPKTILTAWFFKPTFLTLKK
jgi:hypothetical protein